MLDSSPGNAPQFSLGEDQIAVRDMARSFAAEVFAPHAVAWDEAKHFPVAEMRQAAELGMGGIYISSEVGGSGLSRLDATLIFPHISPSICPAVFELNYLIGMF
jgi:alkylation response protein AidB-like acyl-CoA dehydrogenase